MRDKLQRLLYERWRFDSDFDPHFLCGHEELREAVRLWGRWTKEMGIRQIGFDRSCEELRLGTIGPEDLVLNNPIAMEFPTEETLLVVPRDVALKLLFLGAP